jgi:hypothetical protein
MARLPMEVLMRIQVPGTEAVAFAETRNVSARGLYFYTHAQQLEPGQELDCVLILPQKLTQAGGPTFVGCRGKVLRVNKDLPGNRVGVAVEVSSYDFSWHGDLLFQQSGSPPETAEK